MVSQTFNSIRGEGSGKEGEVREKTRVILGAALLG